MSDFFPSKVFRPSLNRPQRFSELLKRFGSSAFDGLVREWDAEQIAVFERRALFNRDRQKAFKTAQECKPLLNSGAAPPCPVGWIWENQPLENETGFVESWIPERLKAEHVPQSKWPVPIPDRKMPLCEACSLLAAIHRRDIPMLKRGKLSPYWNLRDSVGELTETDEGRLFDLLDWVDAEFKQRFPMQVTSDDSSAMANCVSEGDDNRIPVAQSARVKLYGPDEEPEIDGQRVAKLTAAQYDVVEALLKSGPRGLGKDDLDAQSGHSAGRKILKRISGLSKAWMNVVAMAETTGQRYRIG